MEIEKTKRKGSKCYFCRKEIDFKYRVSLNRGNAHAHLSCYFNYVSRRFEEDKKDLKQFSKTKYKKQMILERLK